MAEQEENRKVGFTVIAENETKGTLQEIKADAADMASSVEKSGARAARGIGSIGESADGSAQKTARAQGRITSELLRITEQTRIAAEAGGSLSKAFEIKANMRGLDASQLAPFVQQLREAENALAEFKAKEAELVAQNAFAEKHRQAQQLVKTAEYVNFWAQELDKAEKEETELAAQNAFAKKHQQAKELAKASQYASWWSQELDKAEAAERKLAAEKSFINSLKAQSEAIGKTRADLLEMQAAQMGISNQAAPFIAKLREAEHGMTGAGMSAKAMSAAMRGVPAQISDIVVSLQGGMSPMTVFFQQGLQLRDMFDGFVPAAKALGSTLLGLITPFAAVGAAVAVLGLAYYQGSKEVDEYRKALVLSGNQAGTSVDQLNAMARAMAPIVGTQGSAAAGLAEMARSSKVGSDNLKEFTTSAVLWQKATGQAVSDTAKQFAQLAKDPLKASLALNEQMNHLTASVYDQIKALEAQGRTEEAAAVAQKAYSDAMTSRRAELVQNLGYIERATQWVTEGAKKMWDAILGVGRQSSPTDQAAKHLERLEKELALRLERGPTNELVAESHQKGNEDLKRRIQQAKDFLSVAGSVDTFLAGEQKKHKDYVDAMEDYSRFSAQFATKEIQRNRDLTVEKNKYNTTLAATKKAFEGMPELEDKLAELKNAHEKSIADINKRYEEKGSSKPARDALSIDVFGTKKELEGLVFAYSSAQKIMEAQRSAGLLNDAEYYEARRGFINLEADAQEILLNKELQRFKQEKVTKDNRLQVEKGIADTQAKLDKSRIDRAVALQVLGLQETAAINAQKASLDAAERSAADYLATLQRGFDRSVQAVGWGSERRSTESGRQQIEDRYSQQRTDLANQRAQAEILAGKQLNDDQRKMYDERLEIIDRYEALALSSYEDGVSRRLAAEGNWLNGVSRAWQDYSYSAANVAQMSADAFTNAFKGMEDGLVNFARTGKLNFKDVANTFIAEVIRMQARAAMSGLFGSLFGAVGLPGLGSAGAGVSASSIANAGISFGVIPNALGGVYDSPSLSRYQNQVIDKPTFFAFAKGGVPSLGVGGEAGPEAVMPLTRAPDGNLGVRALGAPAKPSIQIVLSPTINIDSRADRAEVEALVIQGMNIAVKQAKSQLIDEMGRGMA